MILQNVIDISLNLKSNPKLYVEIITEYICNNKVPGCIFNLKQRGGHEVLISKKFKTIKEAESIVDIIRKVDDIKTEDVVKLISNLDLWKTIEVNMYYQVTTEDEENIYLGNEDAIIKFVNDMNEGADELLDNISDAVDWLEQEGFEVEKRRDLVERLNAGELIYIK